MNRVPPQSCKYAGLFVLLLCTALPFVVRAETKPTVEWQVTEGGTKVADLVASENGCTALCTIMKPDSTYSSRLIWIDEKGRVLRSCSLGNSRARAMSQTHDHGFVLAGHDVRDEAEITVMDSVGRVLWRRTYHYGFSSDLSHVIPLSDGGFLAVGDTISAKPLRVGALAIRTDEEGNVLWANVFRDEGDTHFRRVAPTRDGGFLLVGIVKSRGPTKQDILIVKVDRNGREISRRYYGTSWYDQAEDVQTLKDSTTVVAGTVEPPEHWKGEVLMMRVNTEGDTLWYRRYSLPGDVGLHAQASGVTASSESSLACVGWLAPEKGFARMFAMGCDTAGNRQWLLDSFEPRTMGFCIAPSPHGGYYLGGARLTEGDQRALVAKIRLMTQ